MTRREMHGWLIVAVFILVMIGIWGAVATVGAFIPPLVKEFGWSRARASSLASFVEIGFCAGCLITGWMIDRIGVRIPMVIGAVLTGAAMILASRAHSFEVIGGANLLGGFGRGMATTVPAAVVVGYWFRRQRGLAMGLTMAGASLGGMIMVEVAARVTAIAGWRTAYVVIGLPIFVIVIPLTIAVVRLRPPEANAAIVESMPAHRRAEATETLHGLTLMESLRTRSFWFLMLMGALWAFSAVGIVTQIMIYLIGIGYSHQIAALALSITFGLTAVGKPFFGIIVDWLGARIAQFIAFVTIAAGCGLLLYSSHGTILAISLLVFGLGWGAPLALLPLVTIQSLGLRYYGSIGGTLSAVNVLGAAGGPLVLGLLFDLTGSYTSGFGLCFCLFIVTALLTLGCRAEFAANAAPIARPALSGA
jgi:MFS family permease